MNYIFDRHYKKYDAWYDKHKFAFLSELAAIKKVLPRNKKGLEIGVGTGRFAAVLKTDIGIEPSNSMLEIARRRGVDARWGYGERLPFFNETFGYVSIIISLCFMSSPLRVLKEARRVLKKNGRIIIGIVDKKSFLGEFYRSKKSVFYKQARFFGVKEATDLLKKSGFAAFRYYQTISVLPDKMNSVEEPKKGFGEGGFVVISAKNKKRGMYV